jgi:hypothetical protein
MNTALHPSAQPGYNPPMETTTLSEAALTLLRRRLAREWVDVTNETLPLYRELVEAGLMIPLATFTRGREGAFRLTELACTMRDGVNGRSSPSPSA